MEVLKHVITNFLVEGQVLEIEDIGSGHINGTYLVRTEVKSYILQRINKRLFPVKDLMNNIKLVTEFLYEKLSKEEFSLKPLTLVYSKDGKSYIHYLDEYYRVFNYIEDSFCYQIVEEKGLFYESALAFGLFTNLLADFPVNKLVEVLPDFHNTKKRFEDFKKVVEATPYQKILEVEPEINFIYARKDICSKIVDLIELGLMPLRVTHNDTKLNNVLFNRHTKKHLAIIDYDTIMPGSICYDFGDAIRFGCSSALEDETDLSKVFFQMDLFEEYVQGYLFALGDSISLIEKEHLAFSCLLMTLETGIRFLKDHLEGDIYYRIHRPNQNLDRCRTQLTLYAQMKDSFQEMKDIIDFYYHKYSRGKEK